MKRATEETVRWVDEAAGLPCVARKTSLGIWCGYVGTKRTIPFPEDLDVHGGVTYTGDRVANEDPDGYSWIGFDCAHYGDHIPGLLGGKPLRGDEVYRDLDFVKGECAKLASQLEDA